MTDVLWLMSDSRVQRLPLGEMEYGHRVVSLTDTPDQISRNQFVENQLPHTLDVRKTTKDYYGLIRARLLDKYAPTPKRKKGLRPEQLIDPVTSKELGIQENDVWIAAQALEYNLVLVTHDILDRLYEVASDILMLGEELMAESFEYPLALHITFGTYGTRLHGNERGTVWRSQNRVGERIIGKDVVWERLSRSQLNFSPVLLNHEQRQFVEETVPAVCDRGGWEYHIAAGEADHAHVMLTSSNDGKATRKWLKSWLGQHLSERWPLKPGQTWWAEGGSIRQVWKKDYFANVFQYIGDQRLTPFDSSQSRTL